VNGNGRSSFELDLGDVCLFGVDAGAGPPVVLLHAGGDRHQVWAPVVARLSEAGYRAIAVDQRGHGRSSGSRADGLAAYGRDVNALARHLTVRCVCSAGVTLVGASLGGLAILAAHAGEGIAAPIAGVVLVDVVPDPDPTRTRAHLGRVDAATGGGLAVSPLVDDALARADELRAGARAIEAPTTLVRGGASPTIDDDDVARFRGLVPHVAVRTVAGAGHLVARDQPEGLARVLLDHLAAGPSGRRGVDLPPGAPLT
jgi:pimeloyl-ACP methyl ester carboxylesterase